MLSGLADKLLGWADLGEAEISAIMGLPGTRLFLARGDHPFDRIRRRDQALLILDGWAAEYKDRPNGRRVIVELLLPGDLTHLEPTAMNPESVGTMMLSQGCGMLIPHASLQELLRYQGIALAMRCSEHVRGSVCREWLVNIGSRKVDSRLAHLLCELSVRACRIGLGDGAVSEMPLTQSDLADALCVTDAHLNVALQRLRKMKAISLSEKRLQILDWPYLTSLGEFDAEYLGPWRGHRTFVKGSSVGIPRVGALDLGMHAAGSR